MCLRACCVQSVSDKITTGWYFSLKATLKLICGLIGQKVNSRIIGFFYAQFKINRLIHREPLKTPFLIY